MANSLMRLDPFRDIARFDPFRDMDELFRDFSPQVWRQEQTPRMRMDVTETEKEYTVKAEIPGVQKEDIKVAVNGNQVSLTAEIKEEKSADGGGAGGTLRSERYHGQLHRSFTLPQEVDDDQAGARYENGVLTLTLPKKVGTGGKQLAIQ
ncbi:Hsp20/alpha crystallin family protein [Oxalobacteraceae bacterium OTU3CAMAD1]|nr:Hsp20/alpha crystallin family protein [Oxalobacteraceae bacterium OTU3CAMAD1]